MKVWIFFALILTISSALEAATFPVTNTNDADAGSLRQAILDANANAGEDVITFDSGVTGTITLTTGELEITEGVTITGPGANLLSISGNNNSRVFNILPGTFENPVTVNIDSLTITGGNAGNGGGILTDVFTILNLMNSAVSNNSAVGPGGGIYCSEGEVHLTNSTVSDNSAASGGGGIWITRNSIGGVLTLTNSTVSGNTVSGGGGGILLYLSSATFTNSTLSNNSADVNSAAVEFITRAVSLSSTQL
jgi:parallel beta-helix repeat protein